VSVAVYQTRGDIKVLQSPESLSGEDALYGFTMSVKDISEG
jgi:hypothetical protein